MRYSDSKGIQLDLQNFDRSKASGTLIASNPLTAPK